MRQTVLAVLACGVLCCWNATAHSAPTFYTSSAAFNAAAPGLPVETFENNSQPNGGVFSFSEPLNSASNNGSFSPGDILPGLSVGVVGSGTSMVLLTQGFAGVPSDVVGPNSFADNLELIFGPPVTAVGFEILAPVGAGQTMSVDVFGPGNVLLGSTTFVSTTGPKFIGVIDGTSISRITVNDPNGVSVGQLVDNVSFGNAIVPEPITLATFGLMGVAGAGYVRRRMKATPTA